MQQEHGTNLVIGVINQEGKHLTHRKLDCDLADVEKFLATTQAAVAVDGRRIGLQSVLVRGRVCGRAAIPLTWPTRAKIEQYRRMKHADDKHDAFNLAELQRLNILPIGFGILWRIWANFNLIFPAQTGCWALIK